MGTSLMTQDKTEARKKGMIAASAWGGTALLFAVSAPFFLVAGAGGGAAYFTYKWFMFRAKRGMRF